MKVTKATMAGLLEVEKQGGKATCGSFARGRYNNNRAQLSGGRTLMRIAQQGYLWRDMELVGSYQVIWYGLTTKGKELLEAWHTTKRGQA